MKLLYAASKCATPSLPAFMETLEPKLRQKLFQQFILLLTPPLPREPIVKHFTITKYSGLYELRAKSKIVSVGDKM